MKVIKNLVTGTYIQSYYDSKILEKERELNLRILIVLDLSV